MRRKFSDVFIDCTKNGVKVKTSEYHNKGKYAIIDQGQNRVAGYTDITEGVFKDIPAIVFGDHTRIIKYIDAPFFIGADGVKVLRCRFPDANYKYLYYALKNAKIPDTGYNRHFKWLKEIQIEYPNQNRQQEIVQTLDRTNAIIESRQRQLRLFDDLIKARFVEMFGDPVHNTAKIPVLPMTEVCEIIDGDRGKNYPTQEEFFDEGYCLFLNAKNVTKHGFDFSDCMFITKEKDAALRKGKLQRGDVVLTTRGTLENLAFYAEVVPFENVRINSGMVILRMNRSLTNETFFIEQFRLQLDDIKATIASGSAQPQLPISTMNKIRLVMPELSRQRQFSRFVIQVEKTKSAVQKALDEAQTLFDSLMQKYFG